MAWQAALKLANEVHYLIQRLPREERDVTGKQLRKSVKSTMANIAEGFGRHTYRDKASKYTIARGENSETKAHLLIGVALGFLKEADIQKSIELCDTTGRLLSGLIRASRNRV